MNARAGAEKSAPVRSTFDSQPHAVVRVSLVGVGEDMLVALGIGHNKLFDHSARNGTVDGVVLVPLCFTLAHAVAENGKFDLAIGKGGVFLVKGSIFGEETKDALCGGGVVATLGVEVVGVAEVAVGFGEGDFTMNISTNIVNGQGVKRIDTLEPIAVELKDLYIKRGVVGIAIGDFKLFNISVHLLGNVAKLAEGAGLATHTADIDFSLVCVVGGGEQHRVVPYLFYNKVTLDYNGGGVRIVDNITDIVTKRLFKVGGFGVKYNDIHLGFPFFLYCTIIISYFMPFVKGFLQFSCIFFESETNAA